MMPATSALDRLDEALERRRLEAELFLIGGAVMTVVFRAFPGTRRASALLGSREALDDAVSEVAESAGLPADWLPAATRQLITAEGVSGVGRDGRHLRIFSPLPDYALSLKCAELGAREAEERRAVEADVRYLLRLMGISSATEALERVGTYFTPRQLSPELPEILEGLF